MNDQQADATLDRAPRDTVLKRYRVALCRVCNFERLRRRRRRRCHRLHFYSLRSMRSQTLLLRIGRWGFQLHTHLLCSSTGWDQWLMTLTPIHRHVQQHVYCVWRRSGIPSLTHRTAAPSTIMEQTNQTFFPRPRPTSLCRPQLQAEELPQLLHGHIEQKMHTSSEFCDDWPSSRRTSASLFD